jgi:hypothetical protein
MNYSLFFFFSYFKNNTSFVYKGFFSYYHFAYFLEISKQQ